MKIDKELDELFGDLVKWEYESLKADIKANGIKVPLVVSGDGTIVCGHQRYKIAQELKIPEKEIPVNPIGFKTRQEMIDYAINDNLHRRNLNPYQKALLGLKLLPAYKKEAKKRIDEAWKKRFAKTKKDVDKNAPQMFGGVKGEAMKLVADRVGVSDETLRKVRKIEEYKSSDDFDIKLMRHGLKIGETSISHVYYDIVNKEKALLKGKGKKNLLPIELAFDAPCEKIFKTLADRFHLRNDLTTSEAEKEESVLITDKYNLISVYSKTDIAKKCLTPFANIDIDEKKKIQKYKIKGVNWDKIAGDLVQSKFRVNDLSYIIELLKKFNESEVDFKYKTNGPIEISTENFGFIIAPIVKK
ncbi:MAG: ParB/RepB/Spo0J family partition protein [Promethearchaeota archaeon]